MKSLSTYLFIVAVFVAFGGTAYAQTGRITVEVYGIDEIKGHMVIALYNRAEDFPEVDKEYIVVRIKITGKSVTHTFSDIPGGDYAIAVYHDSNDSGEIDTNFLGIPQEGYGFSRDAPVIFSAPDFEDASFKLIDHSTVNIHLRY